MNEIKEAEVQREQITLAENKVELARTQKRPGSID